MTVFVLILPFLLIPTPLVALPLTMLLAVGIIAVFTFYVSIAQELRFWHRFGEMAGLSLGVAVVSFGVGFLVRSVFGIEL
jgi:VIT1/CCC1 family predicted Fe2+/Mn2+ transporter